MARREILDLAKRWRPAEGDPRGPDKRVLLNYLLAHGCGIDNAVSLSKVSEEANFSKRYSVRSIQQQLMVPLRDEGRVFIGTSNRGIFVLKEAADAVGTIDFYTTRIRSELKHLRSVKSLARRYRLFKDFRASKATDIDTLIYFDESGTPSLRDKNTSPFFIVCGILIEDRRLVKRLRKRFEFIAEAIGKPKDYEFHSGSLSRHKHERVLKELALVDFQWAAVCFVKDRLTSKGFQDSKAFYKFAYQFLAGDLLSIAWRAELYFDEYGGKRSKFADEFQTYLKERNTGLPQSRLKSISILDSGSEHLIQLADLVAGVIKNKVKGTYDLLHLLDDKMISFTVWPLR